MGDPVKPASTTDEQAKAEDWLRQVANGREPTVFDAQVSAPILLDLIERLRGVPTETALLHWYYLNRDS